MDATFNTGNESQPASMEAGGKSDLMQFFEHQVSDMYWAYKDLLKAVFESEE